MQDAIMYVLLCIMDHGGLGFSAQKSPKKRHISLQQFGNRII